MSVTIRIANDANPKHTLNLANGNFATLWAALGLEFDWAGALDARIIAGRLATTEPDLIVRAGHTEEGWVACGIEYPQAQRYLTILGLLANVAAKREEQIVWG